MDKVTAEQVLRTVKEKNIHFIQFWFTDVLGMLKSFSVSPSELETALQEGMGFDGSSIEGFARIEESDMIAMPDPATFTVIPWLDQNGSVARVFCDIVNPDLTPYDGDPRYALKKMIKRAADKGYTFFVGPELEYFYFTGNQSPEILDRGGYFDMSPSDLGGDIRRATVKTLQQMGITVEYSHHEVAQSQHEIDLRYGDALKMADTVMTSRITVKEIAGKFGMYATFMPKPILGQNGSGMHVHQSLFRGENNAMYDPSDAFHLSDMAKHYIAGLLKHAREITAVTSQWVNSYKRLVPGYEAPVYISWARRNRSTLVRVPMYKPGKEKATRIEYRSPDPSCNPYLTFAVMLAAGLEGIEKKYPLPAPVEEDIYTMPPEKRKKKKIYDLPGSLVEAVQEVEKSRVVRDALGEHIFKKFIENKRVEWDLYRMHVSRFEIDKYLPIL
ncbi:MAG TPA: glutamine synthetase family protein [Syntrophales bacterium]|nr:glutamine synthetase family protein [Syntrophales bacterium]